MLIQWLNSPEQQSLKRAFTTWIGREILPQKFSDQEIPEFKDLQEINYMLSENVKAWTMQWKKEGQIEGKIEGIEMQKASLNTILRSRFSNVSNEMLSAIESITNLEHLKDLIIQAALTDNLETFENFLNSLPD